VRAEEGVNRAPRRALVNGGPVNGGGFQFFPAAKCAIFCVFTRKYAIQKVR
jgi:hypothetical protein